MQAENSIRSKLGKKKRIVIKIGSSSLAHKESGQLDLIKLEILVREITDLRNQGKDVVLVSSGAIMVGRTALDIHNRPRDMAKKQACASVGQAKLMMIYQKLFSEYNQICSQILMTKNNINDPQSRENAHNTFEELLSLGVVPIVNENDTVSTYEMNQLSTFGDNDTLSAIVTRLVNADLLILLSDIDGLYTDDPRVNPNARFVDLVEHMDESFQAMGKGSSSDVGTGGMTTKLQAARMATQGGSDMVIANGDDFHNIHKIMSGEAIGTLFLGNEQ